MEKDKKKTLTISSDLKKKINTSFVSSSNKKSFSVEKKKPIRSNKNFNRNSQNLSHNAGQNNQKKNYFGKKSFGPQRKKKSNRRSKKNRCNS